MEDISDENQQLDFGEIKRGAKALPSQKWRKLCSCNAGNLGIIRDICQGSSVSHITQMEKV